MSDRINRREALGVVGATAVFGGVIGRASAQDGMTAHAPTRQRTMRIAHLTDIHVEPERRANEGMIACLHHVQNIESPPDLILSGGDHVFDSFEANNTRTTLLWNMFQSILKNECSLKVHSCIGNHDIWGWYKSRSGCTGSEPNYGKKRALEMLGLAKPYSSFDLPGSNGKSWHIIMLDSTQPDGDGYLAFLDEEQFDWLERDVAATDSRTPILVLSHIPIITAMVDLFLKREANGDATVSGSLAHTDARKIADLFAKHPNVKLCLSGHLHHIDRVDFNGVTYLCNGAVSGNWWKGRHYECDEGYAIIDLFDDGSFDHQYLTYGWKAEGN